MSAKRGTKRGPRWKRMKRQGRLDHAKSTGWVNNYQGRDIIKGYSKWFAVDPLCAVTELRMLGVPVSQEQEAQIQKAAHVRAEARKQAKETAAQKERNELYAVSDDTFAYVAGHTSGGAPYGVTWEEVDEIPPWCEADSIEP